MSVIAGVSALPSAAGLGGLIGLGATAAAAICVAYTAGIVREAHRPRRATFGWALANGIPTDPGPIAGVISWSEYTTAVPPPAAPAQLSWWNIRTTGPSQRTALLVHGWGRSKWDSLRRLALLAPLCDRVIVPDLRGHGDSTGRTSVGADDHLDLMSVLGDAGVDPSSLVVVGHSMGAVVAARLAAALASVGSPCRGVVLYAPYDELLVPMGNRLLIRALPRTPFAQVAQWWMQPRTELTHRAVARCDCPVIAVAGGADVVTPPAACARAAAPRDVVVERDLDHADVGTQGQRTIDALRALLA